MIHPTAIIDASASIADDVSIGPYTVIGANVSIDSGTKINSHVTINGTTKIGKNNRIYQFSSIGEDPQDKKYAGEPSFLEIGDNNEIREFTSIHRGTTQDKNITKIGSNNLFMAYCHVAHDCVIADDVILANAASLAGHVHIGQNVILGGFSIVHQFCQLGDHCFSAMGSAITKDVPPFVMVGGRPTKPHGINAVGLDRRGFSKEAVLQIKRAYKTLYKSGLKLVEANEQLAVMAESQPELQVMVDFLQNSNRGIMR
ncbi:MAG: acyl-ACP--UDP-N-acetylglucosamine O-acyltransferase [Cycloclasticus sp.]|nr:acyl-[acyl-carrier-protein]--UDP-N-acetylglucosamine O-acyltransferase [Cycloclasticus sp. 46_83_sub15_T18]OUR81825.1 acyl-[acyl-carrier-protein]--UDP-N-acetylglucosamine O-acyltransferase [Cycloclasticus sp. 46_120_T64]